MIIINSIYTPEKNMIAKSAAKNCKMSPYVYMTKLLSCPFFSLTLPSKNVRTIK